MKKTILISIAIFMMAGAKAQVAMSPRVGFETQCLGVEDSDTTCMGIRQQEERCGRTSYENCRT